MPKRTTRQSVDRRRSQDYRKVAEHFPDAAGVLIVHSAIAYADAISIRLSGQKSASESHEDAITLLESIAADGEKQKNAINQFKRIISEKSKVSYFGDLYDETSVREMWKRLERFRNWANSILKH
ncbi:MAG: hypothetical protein Q8K98_02870 [Bacteroidota bacterium]|nr:hypothetical protein [Bacteroidota bacterium]